MKYYCAYIIRPTIKTSMLVVSITCNISVLLITVTLLQ